MQNAVLQRMIRRADDKPVENPLTTSRAVRLALTKAANDASGLLLSVSSVSEYANTLDHMLDELPAGLMLVALSKDDHPAGFIAIDQELRAAVLEMATMGEISSQVAEGRKATAADLAMCRPLIATFLDALPEAVIATDLAGWADGMRDGDRMADTRSAGLVLEDGQYRVLHLDVQFTGTDRQGALLMALPPVKAEPASAPVTPPPLDWALHFPAAVAAAPAALTALLCRIAVPLHAAQSLKAGSVLPLTGCTVSSVRLLASDGTEVTQAKLGQSGGMRAVRIEAAPVPDMHDLETQATGPTLPDVPAQDLLGPEAMAIDPEAAGRDEGEIAAEPLGEDMMFMAEDEDPLAAFTS